VLSTRRLLLRSPTFEELLVAVAAGSDPEAQRWLGWEPAQLVPEPARQILLNKRVRTGRSLHGRMRNPAPPVNMVAIDLRNSSYAGMATIIPVDGRSCEIGGTLSPAHRGQGLGAELFSAAYLLGHGHFGFGDVRAGTEPGNLASIRSLERAGFVPAAGAPTHTLPDGRIVPAAWFVRSESGAGFCQAADRPGKERSFG
jgi:RimJ/RimL family protein N-acetyltransferase